MAIGIEGLGKVVDAVGEGINVLYKVTHGSGIFAAFSLSDELSALSSVNAAELKAELLDLSPEERADLVARLKSKLVLADKQLELKLEEGADLLNEAVDLAFEGLGVYYAANVLVEKAKKLVA